jgi:hypothetical protein
MITLEDETDAEQRNITFVVFHVQKKVAGLVLHVFSSVGRQEKTGRRSFVMTGKEMGYIMFVTSCH